MSTPERSQTVRSATPVEASQEQQGSNVQRPPAFQLQATPLAPVQRQNQPGQESAQENAQQEGAENQLGDSGRVGLGQQVTPATTEPPTVGPEWDEFAAAFSIHFVRILPEFDPSVQVGSVSRRQAIRMAQGAPVAPAAESEAEPAPATEQPAAAPQTRGQRRNAGRPARGTNRGRRPATPATANAPVQAPQAPTRRHEPTPLPRISGARLAALFSNFHRVELMRYMQTHRIPPVLFNGGDVGNLTASQRLVLSAHILTYGIHERGEHLPIRQERVDAGVERIRHPQGVHPQGRNGQHPQAPTPASNGTATPANSGTATPANPAQSGQATPAVPTPPVADGPLTQRVHAHNCGDWALYVTQYAGMTRRMGEDGGSYSSFDLMGHLLTGNANYHETMGGRAQSGRVIHGQAESAQGGDLQGDQLAAYQAEDRRYQAELARYRAEVARGNPNHMAEPRNPLDNFGRHPQVSWAAIQTIQPGDWLWIYNANPDRMGSHSVIFVRWLHDAEQLPRPGGGTFNARRALCYSQHSPDSGGVDDEVMIGEMFAAGAKPITLIRHMEAGGAATVDDLTPRENAREQSTIENANEDYVVQIGRSASVQRTFDQAAFARHLMARNLDLIQQLAARESQVERGAASQPSIMSAQQRALYEQANTTFATNAAQSIGSTSNASAQSANQQGGQSNAQGSTATPPTVSTAQTRRQGLMQLVMLYQRLVQLNENAQIRRENIENQVSGSNGLNARHQRFEEARAIEAALTPRERAMRNRAAAARPAGQGGAHAGAVEPYVSSIPGGQRHSASQATGLLNPTFSREELLPFFTIPGAPDRIVRPRPQQGRRGAARRGH